MSGRDKQNPARVTIKKGATFFLNGALIQAHGPVNAEIHLADVLLMPSQILKAEAARTPLQRLYYLIQQGLLEPTRAAFWRTAFEDCRRSDEVSALGASLEPVLTLVDQQRPADALAQLRRMIRTKSLAA